MTAHREIVIVSFAITGTDARALLARAAWWVQLLAMSEPGLVFVAPALTWMYSGIRAVDADEIEVARRVDGVAWVGGEVSERMARVADVVLDRGGWVADLSEFGANAPHGMIPGIVADRRRRRGELVDMIGWLRNDCVRSRSRGGR